MRKFRLNYKLLILAVFTVALALFVQLHPTFITGVKDIFFSVSSEPMGFIARASKAFTGHSELIAENLSLKAEVRELRHTVNTLEELKLENDRLRKLLGFKRKIRSRVISAEVIARDATHWAGSLVINAGSNYAVGKGSAVCTSTGLLGIVADAGLSTSTVMLLTHPGFKTGAIIRETRVSGIMSGTGDNMLKLSYLPMDADVRPGQTVLTSGASMIFPKGIPVGVIQSVHKSKTGLYKYAIVRPSADPYDQEEVLCLVK